MRASLCAIEEFRRSRPDAVRVVIGDISLPEGGPFGPEYGGLGHSSHQNGLDVDVYYPRLDKAEVSVSSVTQIDRAASQALLNKFLAAGAVTVFIGRGLGLVAPPGYEKVVQPARKHLDHFHVRFAPQP